jgi:putative FmdB family regulatory protein
MPTYEYQCTACQKHVEKFQKMSDEPLLDCPHCHEPQLTRQISAPAFQLKGTGWYVTDFKDNKGEEKKSDTSTASDNTVGTETK